MMRQNREPGNRTLGQKVPEFRKYFPTARTGVENAPLQSARFAGAVLFRAQARERARKNGVIGGAEEEILRRQSAPLLPNKARLPI
jgi:hypothetical protein